jgi:phosphoserine phosphatase
LPHRWETSRIHPTKRNSADRRAMSQKLHCPI